MTSVAGPGVPTNIPYRNANYRAHASHPRPYLFIYSSFHPYVARLAASSSCRATPPDAPLRSPTKRGGGELNKIRRSTRLACAFAYLCSLLSALLCLRLLRVSALASAHGSPEHVHTYVYIYMHFLPVPIPRGQDRPGHARQVRMGRVGADRERVGTSRWAQGTYLTYTTRLAGNLAML